MKSKKLKAHKRVKLGLGISFNMVPVFGQKNECFQKHVSVTLFTGGVRLLGDGSAY